MGRVSARSPHKDDQIDGFLTGLLRWLAGFHGDERGQSMPLMLTAMGLALIGGVLVVDIGLLLDERRQAQGAADFAALAAAQDLPRSATDPDVLVKIASAETVAHEYLEWNGFDETEPDVTHIVNSTYAGDVDKIEVMVRRTRPWLFGSLFGLGDITVQGRAVAAANALPRDVAIVLDRSGSMCLFSHGGPKGDCSYIGFATGSSSSTPNPLTGDIPAQPGDMVVLGATSGNSGSYTAGAGLTLMTTQDVGASMTFSTAQELASTNPEDLSMQHSGPNRQQLVATTLPNDGSNVAAIGSWQTGLSSHVAPAGSNRTLVFITGWEDGDGSGNPDLNYVRYGGEDLTRVDKNEAGTTFFAGVEVWILEDADISSASGSSFAVSWDESVTRVAYAHAFYENVLQGGLSGWEPFDTMRSAADSFVDNFEPYVEGSPFDYMALVSYNSAAQLEQGLTLDYIAPGNVFETALWAMIPENSTNIGHAIYEARTELENNGTLGHIKVIVLLTDGLANRYRSGGTDASPVFSSCSVPCTAAENYARDEAQKAADVGMAIYTIGLTGNAGETLLQDIANIGANSGAGGQFFDVDNPADLNDTFNQIAELLNFALIE